MKKGEERGVSHTPSVTLHHYEGNTWQSTGSVRGQGLGSPLAACEAMKVIVRDSLLMLGEHWLYPTYSTAAVSHASALSNVIGSVSVGGASSGRGH